MQRPWNRPSLPVYSLSTCSGENRNMNICTYVTSISMQPKRYIIGVYKQTYTLKLLQEQPEFLLQLLSEKQYRLVQLLGKTSGYQHNKIIKLKEPIAYFQYHAYLEHAAAFILCRAKEWTDAGDHYAILCDVITYRNLNPDPILTTDFLRKKKIIRA